jgi:hypothetical protein
MKEERTSHLLRGGSLRSRILNDYLTIVHFMHIETNVFNLLYEPNEKGLPQQVEVAQGVPGRLRPQIFLKFVTMGVVGRHLYAPAAFIPG